VGSTQDARNAYREHIGGFYTSGRNYGKPYLKNGWRWPLVRFAAGGDIGKPYIDLKVHPAAVAYYQAVAAILLFWGYTFNEWAGGTVSMRNIGGISATRIAEQVRRQYPLATSMHSIFAFDINPSKNPIGSSRPDELDQARWQRMIQDIKNITTISGHKPTKWGGDWRIDDDMHFEPTACTRRQLESGIKTTTVPGWGAYAAWAPEPTRPLPPPEEDGMSIKRGDPKSKGCAEAQKAMRQFFGQDNGNWPPHPGASHYDGLAFNPGEDGSPGATFETNVKNSQKMVGIAETGVFDGFTAGYILAGYGAGGGAGLSAAGVDKKVATHAADPAGHGHRHPEGTSGQPIK
jgi:hypothetical protein